MSEEGSTAAPEEETTPAPEEETTAAPPPAVPDEAESVEEEETIVHKNVFEEQTRATGKRQRKAVEQFAVATVPKKQVEFVLPEGSGTPLGEIENVAFYINKYQAGSDELKLLYRFCFGKVGKKAECKKQLRLFKGLPGMTEKLETMISGLTMAQLKTQLTICDQETGGKKEDLVERLGLFLVAPKGSGGKSIESKMAGKKEAAAKKKARLERKKEIRKLKIEKNKRKKERAKAKREKLVKKKAKATKKKEEEEEEDSEEDSEEETEESEGSEEEEEEDPPPKKKAKKKASKVDSSDSDDDAPIGAMRPKKVTSKMMQDELAKLSKLVEFETFSLKMIRNKIGEALGVTDMSEYKGELKELVVAFLEK